MMLNLLQQLSVIATDDDPNVLRAPASNEQHVRAFGGQLVAQALVAAGATVPSDRPCHSLHAYFLRPGAVDVDAEIRVETIRDGRSFSLREARTRQRQRDVFLMTASFQKPESGFDHSVAMPDYAAPESLPRFDERFAGREDGDMARWFERVSSFDVRYDGASAFDHPAGDVETGSPQRARIWFRCVETLASPSANPFVHQALLAYASDLGILDPILLTHGRQWTESTIMGASLDHAIWFHRSFDAGQWMLFDQYTTVAGGGRGLASANVWAEDGRLLATVTQEALLRAPYSADSAQ